MRMLSSTLWAFSRSSMVRVSSHLEALISKIMEGLIVLSELKESMGELSLLISKSNLGLAPNSEMVTGINSQALL